MYVGFYAFLIHIAKFLKGQIYAIQQEKELENIHGFLMSIFSTKIFCFQYHKRQNQQVFFISAIRLLPIQGKESSKIVQMWSRFYFLYSIDGHCVYLQIKLKNTHMYNSIQIYINAISYNWPRSRFCLETTQEEREKYVTLLKR